MTAAEEIRRLDERLERIEAAAEPVRAYLNNYSHLLSKNCLKLLNALLDAIDGNPPEEHRAIWERFNCTCESDPLGRCVVHKPSIDGKPPETRPRQFDCQMEPPYPGKETVLASLRDPERTAHAPTVRCPLMAPHLIAECGEFDGKPEEGK